LERLETGHPGAGLEAPVPAGRKGVPVTCMTIGLRQDGLSHLPWALNSVQIGDITGNRWGARLLGTHRLPGQETHLQAALDGALWSSESAWRFDLELMRTADFAATNVLTVANLRVPATNRVTEINQDYLLAGQSLRLLSLLGSRAYRSERGGVQVRLDAQGNSIEEPLGLPLGGYLKLLVDSKGAEAGQRVTLMTATDERGRPVQVERGHSYPAGNLNYLLAAGPDARYLTLRFVRQECRSVSFVARPTRITLDTRR